MRKLVAVFAVLIVSVLPVAFNGGQANAACGFCNVGF